MKRRTIPGTDLELSVVGFGCWAIGGKWWGDDVRDDVSTSAIHAALDHGINWFDTAPLYGHGHADEVLVRALGPRLRDDAIVIATKVGARWDGEGAHARSDLSPEHVRDDVEASLRRLGVERLDLVQVHWPCENATPLEDTLGALEDLRREGKVRHYGLCNYDPPQLEHALSLAGEEGGIRTLQTAYSLLRREFEGGLRSVCAPDASSPRLGVLAYEPLCRGLLSGKFRTSPRFPDTDMRARDDRFSGLRFGRAAAFVHVLSQVAAKVGVPTSALAIGWVAARPGVTAVIAGAKTPEQVQENVRAAEIVDHSALWNALQPIADRHRG